MTLHERRHRMCRQPGSGILYLDREQHKLRAVVSCGCGDREIAISEAANGPLLPSIDYRPQPLLTRVPLGELPDDDGCAGS